MLTANGVFARFTTMSAHLTILIMIFWHRSEYVGYCSFSSDKAGQTDTQFIIALSLSIALLVIELIIFLIGPSLLRNKITFLTTILHSAGAISLAFMIFTQWCSVSFWPVFANMPKLDPNNYRSTMPASMIEEIKVVVVGDGYTGKTTLCIVYKDGEYPQDPYVPTIFENYAATVTLNNRKYILNLFDSAGQEEYDQLRIMAYPNTNIFILCFSVVDPDSYSNILSKWIPELNRYAPRVPIILVGTKLDLRNDQSTLDQLAEKNQQPISQSQGDYLAHVCSAKVYLECSSMLNYNVRNVFEQAIDIHNSYEERYCNRLSNGRRILSDKLHSCSWFQTLFCCTKGLRKSQRKNHRDRYTV
ncbi:unnamed protein product [Adineta steineri]|uniref:Uncharacterized protein n=1 Tax=Adineta steineri TaxID=433720 RepID=A0A818X664_9BILA|nr:unnamed protein product [Adineta steineri]CAF3735980.1 unnamed protein product [Adineta steineri]